LPVPARIPPPLPRRLSDPAVVSLTGTALWFVAWVGLLVAHLVGERPLDDWFWTATAGWALGLLGYSLFRWQRSAARRGSRSAQEGV